MPRQRYRQNPLPLDPDAPPVELYGPEQPNPPGLQVAEQGRLAVVPPGPLFEPEIELPPSDNPIKEGKKLDHDPSRPTALTG
jgi:hypothetical protein